MTQIIDSANDEYNLFNFIPLFLGAFCVHATQLLY